MSIYIYLLSVQDYDVKHSRNIRAERRGNISNEELPTSLLLLKEKSKSKKIKLKNLLIFLDAHCSCRSGWRGEGPVTADLENWNYYHGLLVLDTSPLLAAVLTAVS